MTHRSPSWERQHTRPRRQLPTAAHTRHALRAAQVVLHATAAFAVLTATTNVTTARAAQNGARVADTESHDQEVADMQITDLVVVDDRPAACPGQPWCGNSVLLSQALAIRSRLLDEFLWAPPSGSDGTLALSVPVQGPLSSRFGPRFHPILQRTRHHAGIDIGAPSGEVVRAAAPGTVIGAGERGGYGLTVDIDHGDGVVTRYAHLSSIEVSTGQTIPRLATVGYVGSTGLSTGPHLHFEVRVENIAIDPLVHIPVAQITGTGTAPPDS